MTDKENDKREEDYRYERQCEANVFHKVVCHKLWNVKRMSV